MKIAVFYNLPAGGAKRVVEEQIKYLRLNHRVGLYSLKENCRFQNRLLKDYWKFFQLKKLHQQLAAKIDQKNYDVVLVHHDYYTQSPYLLRYLKTPSLYYGEEVLRLVYEYNFRFNQSISPLKNLYEIIFRYFLKRNDFKNACAATKVVVNSYHTKEAFLKVYGINAEVCYPGIDADYFKPLPNVHKKHLLFVGQPCKINGYFFIKKALSLLKNPPPLKVVHGQLSDKELIKAYNEAIATICCSEAEPFGLVPLESLSCATPVVVLKEGGYRETVLDGIAGFLVDRNPTLFAQKIELLAKNQSLAKNMGQAGRRYVIANFNWQKSISKLEEILKKTSTQ